MHTSIGYIRKSSAPSKHTRTVSYEVQEQAVRELADRHGDSLTAVLSDWGKSGGNTKRPDYQRLLAMINEGQVQTIYSYSLSRLSRSLLDFADLLERCKARNVRIRLVQEGDVDGSSATGRAFANMAATFAQFERELAAERNQAAVAERRDRGDHLGQAPYGWKVVNGQLVRRDDERPDLVFEAYRKGQSFGAAARLLNEWNVPTRRAGTKWIHGTVADIVRAQAPAELRPALVKRRGATPIGGAIFAGLLECPCGATLTPRKDTGEPTGVSGYYCSRANRTPQHGKMHIAERPILAWAKAEAAHLDPPYDQVQLAEANAQERADLEAQRLRILDAYIAGTGNMTPAERDRRLGAVSDALGRLDAVETVAELVTFEAVDWSRTPRELNVALRALWRSIKLGPDLLPISALWTVPEWRS